MSAARHKDDQVAIARALARIRAAGARGDGFAGFDLARAALLRHPNSLALAYHAILQAARIGALSEASRLFAAHRIAARLAAAEMDAAVTTEDLLALSARLSKDRALAEPGADRPAGLEAAGRDYLAVFERTGGYYPLINAATLFALAGEADLAERYAKQTLALLDHAAPASEAAERSWRALTRLEAALVLGEGQMAAASAAVAAFHGDYGDLSTTIRQLTLLKTARRLDFDVAASLGMPGIVVYAGHIIAPPGAEGHFPAAQEKTVARDIAAFLDARSGQTTGRRFRWAYGSLAAGADIMVVEALLARQVEVNIVLPFDQAEFIETSVRPAGADWVARFHRCRGKARSFRVAVEGGYFQDDRLFAAASAYAIGLAALQAEKLGAKLTHVLVWDGVSHPDAIAGTDADRRLGQRLGLEQHVVSVSPRSARPPRAPQTARRARRARAMIFADVVGFSRIGDDDLPEFHDQVMRPMAEAIAGRADRPAVVETWGDAVFLVYDDVGLAAAAAMGLLGALRQGAPGRRNLPAHLDLRVSGHFGSTFDITNPFTQRPGCLGLHVSRAARIEPVTPPGVVYVSEAFAAQLALQPHPKYRADFVGTTRLAKKFGDLPVFRLLASV
jgi:hypothetical protein